MTLRDFLKKHRTTISNMVAAHYGENCRPTNDDDRIEWLNNDESLYNWARSEGVSL